MTRQVYVVHEGNGVVYGAYKSRKAALDAIDANADTMQITLEHCPLYDDDQFKMSTLWHRVSIVNMAGLIGWYSRLTERGNVVISGVGREGAPPVTKEAAKKLLNLWDVHATVRNLNPDGVVIVFKW